MNVIGGKKGPCPMCRGDKERELFVVKSPGYNGEICGQHLHVLAMQLNNGKKDEAPLFDGARV